MLSLSGASRRQGITQKLISTHGHSAVDTIPGQLIGILHREKLAAGRKRLKLAN